MRHPGLRNIVYLSFVLIAATVSSLAADQKTANATPSATTGRVGAVASGQYRNLFAEAGHSEAEVTAKLNAAFEQLFHGNPETQAIYFSAGKNANGPLAYTCDIHHNDVRTEGMSYGMMIAVQLDKKQEFDALWNWAKTYMYHDNPKHPSYGFFSWSMKRDGTPNSETPAPDGEEYFVMSLYFASARWGNGTGIYNYRSEADKLLTNMLHRKMITGTTRFGEITEGDMFDSTKKMVRFVPDGKARDFTDPSYHLPAFYELWAQWGPSQDRKFWTDAAITSRDFFQKATNPQTGLAPDYANFDGTPRKAPFNPMSHNFSYDSWRTAMNWSVDWSWWAKDGREQELSNRIQSFFASQGLKTYADQYSLDGKPLSRTHSVGLMATNAVASLAATHSSARQFVEEFWNAPVPSGEQRYYDGMLYLLGYLHCSGHFRVWTPK